MFEVIITYRDFSEHLVDRYATADEARAVAERLSEQRPDQVVRAWVRQVREINSKPS
jgi:hypothetical protein